MSFLSGLGKILGVAGGAIAAPFTGGLSPAALPGILGAGGAAVSALSQGSAQNRDAQFSGQLDLAQILAQNARDKNNANSQYLKDFASQQMTNQDTQQDGWRKLLSTEHALNPQAMPNVSPYAAKQSAPTGQVTQ